MVEIERVRQSFEQDSKSSEELLPMVYDDLRRLATSQIAREAPGQTLQATALVHEAWLRVTGNHHGRWASRRHFFAAAAEAMRRILIEQARRKRAIRHGGGQQRVDLEKVQVAAPAAEDRLLALHDALDRLAECDGVKAELVKLHYFGGLTLEQAGEILGISTPTAKRYWTYARAWLYRELKRVEPCPCDLGLPRSESGQGRPGKERVQGLG